MLRMISFILATCVLFLIHQNRVIYTITTHTRPNVCRWTVELRCL